MAKMKFPYLNLVVLAGHLGDDPKPVKGTGDTVGATFRIAIRKSVQGKKEGTTFVDVIAWGTPGQAALKNLVKGSGVIIQGALTTHEKHHRNGLPTARLHVTVITIQCLDAWKRVNPENIQSAPG